MANNPRYPTKAHTAVERLEEVLSEKYQQEHGIHIFSVEEFDQAPILEPGGLYVRTWPDGLEMLTYEDPTGYVPHGIILCMPKKIILDYRDWESTKAVIASEMDMIGFPGKYFQATTEY